MEEIWKDIPNYEGLYQVSNLGRIKSLPTKRRRWEKMLKQKLTKDGYCETTLFKNGKYKYIRTHRIVAMAFLKKDKIRNEVNHKDGNKLNNNLENLEWVTSSENQKHAYKLGLQKISGGAILNRKKIKCIELNITKESINEMQRYLCEKGYTKSKRLNRLSTIINSKNKKYLGLTFELVKEVDANADKC